MGRIRSKRVTDNVVDLMAGKLSRLPSTTLGALKQLACLGNSAPTAALSMILEMSEGAIDTLLWEVEHAGLVFRVDGGFAFLHDRVQEAVYALIPKMERAATHLRIGRVLAARTPPAELEEKIFEIVNQLDRGAALVDTIDEREQIAELNLRAGKRAKTSTAYASALIYLATGRRLLAEESWQRHYHLTFELEYHQAECEFLTGDLAAAEERLSMLSRRAANLVDLAAVTCRRIAVYTTLDRPDRAVEMGLEFLRHTGVTWSPHPTDKEAEQEFERIWHQLGSRPIEALLDLPQMSDPAWCRRCSPTTTCIVSSSVAWRISASSTATVTDRATPMAGSACSSARGSAITHRGFASANLPLIWLSNAGCSVSRPGPTSVSRTSFPG
jgi:predicted ATPase